MTEETSSRPPLVRPWLRRVALWLGPLLVLILAWQVWDRREEGRLADAAMRLQTARPATAPPSTGEGADRFTLAHWQIHPQADAGAHYLAAQVLSYAPAGTSPVRAALYDALATGTSVSVETRAAVDEILERNRTAFGLVDTAANLSFASSSPLDAQLNQWLPNRAIDNAGSFRTLERVLAGDSDAAASALLSRMKFLRVLDRRPSIFNEGLKSLFLDVLVADLAIVLAHPNLPASRLDDLDHALAGIMADDELEACVHAEALWLHQIGGTLWGSRAALTPVRPRLRQVATGLALTSLEALDVARAPWPARLTGMATLPLHGPTRPVTRSVMLNSEYLRDQYGTLARTVARLVTTVSAARAAIRVEQYRREHGALPSGLDALPPGTDEDWRVDPFSGGSLLLRSDADGFVVYSVGEDGRDDGGQTEPMPRAFDAPGMARRGLDHGIRVR